MRKRYIWDTDQEKLVPADEYYAKKHSKNKSFYVMPDISSFISPIDRTEVSSRSQLREHEKKHGVRQCGELTQASDFDNRKIGQEKTLDRQRRKLL